MPTQTLKKRHYAKIPQLIRRDKGDLPSEDFAVQLRRRMAAFRFVEAAQPPPVRPSNPSLIGTADGAIKRILLTIPKYAVDDPTMSAAYQALIGSLPATTAIVALVQNSAKPTIDSWLASGGRTATSIVDTFEDTLNISIWAEDGYVVVLDKGSGSTYFVEPYSFPRYGDGLVANFVTNFTDIRDTQAPLYFQGGNVLVGDDFFLIGADYPAHSLDYIGRVLQPPVGVTPEAFVETMYRDYLDRERNLIYVGSGLPVPAEQTRPITVNGKRWTETICSGNAKGTTQPLFHIDMFITLIGRSNQKYKLLVGDPKMAFDVLGQTTPEHAMSPIFDDIAESLHGKGFEVVRNPLPLAYMDDSRGKNRSWYFATSNNALVQNSPTKEVWLPTYGYGDWTELAKTDDANKKIWADLGFVVHQLPDFHPFAENLGAVHCIKKYLARG
jgi:hypothetical protein